MSLRIVTFNIQHGRGPDGLVDPDRLADALAGLGADVLGLQEVDVGVGRSGRTDQAALAADATGLPVAFAPANRVGWRGRAGNALLVRGTLDDVDTLVLPSARRGDGRSAVLATARTDAGELSVAVAHLSVHFADARAQLGRVVAALTERAEPRLLLADTNMGRAGVAPVLEAAGLTLAPGPPTFPADAPRVQIDHVAVSGLTIRSAEAPAAGVSDHRPLIVTVD